VIFISLIAAVSCTSDRFYEESRKIEGGSWSVANKVIFPVTISDTSAFYNFYIDVRNELRYPYSNLYLFLQTRFPDGRRTRDTIECMLASPDGKWLGSGTGNLRSNRFLFQQHIRFRQQGIYLIELEQAMRVQDLEGIRDVGIRIDKNVYR